MKAPLPGRGLVLIPAFNEEESIPALLDEVKGACPELDILVVSDGSRDDTAKRARVAGAKVLELPCNLGVGGAVQAGFMYAFENGYDFVARIDGDGQHPPAEIGKLMAAMAQSDADLMVGSRFLSVESYRSSFLRLLGIKLIAVFLSLICRTRVTDPTSGFWLVNRKLLYFFANNYPTEYPEPEALALLRRQGYSFKEVAVVFRARQQGQSSIRGWGTLYFAFKVGLALVIDRLRPIDPRYARHASPV